MKYCPYCGAGLPDGVLSFCPECGNVLPGSKKDDKQPDTGKQKTVMKKAASKKSRLKASKIARKASLTRFISACETRLFDPEQVQEKDLSEVREDYESAVKTLNTLQEFQRKFIVQNKDTLKTTNTEQEKLLNKIMALPPDKMEKLMDILESKEEESPKVEEFETEEE